MSSAPDVLESSREDYATNLTTVVDEPLELDGRTGEALLGRTCAPAPIGLAGPDERLLGHVEPAGPGVDGPHRIPLKTAETAVVGPAPMLGEHTRRALLRRCGRPGRRALGGLEERGGDHATGLVVPVAAGSESSIVGDEPHAAEHERRGQPSQRHHIDPSQATSPPS